MLNLEPFDRVIWAIRVSCVVSSLKSVVMLVFWFCEMLFGVAATFVIRGGVVSLIVRFVRRLLLMLLLVSIAMIVMFHSCAGSNPVAVSV